jgi:DNA-binding PadR family transcriptional regulator
MGGMGSQEAAAQAREMAAMRSPIYWAVLGLVIEQPSYGYELAHRFERLYADLLTVSGMSHIYIALSRLAERGLIEAVEPDAHQGAPVGRQVKICFQSTAAGVDSYGEWLIAQAGESARRSRVFLRQLAVLQPQAALRVLEAYERECVQQLRAAESDDRGELRSPPGNASDECNGERSQLVRRLALEDRRLRDQATLTWIHYARREFAACASRTSQS